MIYDCFPFLNEIEILELRLHTLSDVVDKFVIVEANRTFSGNPKEYFLPRYWSSLAEFRDKIIYVQVDDMPESQNPWTRAFHQKNAIMRGLVECADKDIILVSDLDEIPRPDAIRQLFEDDHCRDLLHSYPIAFAQRNFYYFVNCLDPRTWQGTVAIKFNNLRYPQNLRNLRDRLPRLRFGGWHFSYIGGPERIIYKLNSYCNTMNNTALNNSPEYILDCIHRGSSAIQVGEKLKQYIFVDVDASFPMYMRTLIEKYPYVFFDAECKTLPVKVYPAECAGILSNKPRWCWYLLKQFLKGKCLAT